MNNTPTLNFWPIVVVIEDCYIPELAPLVMEVCEERDAETCGVVMQCWALEAGTELGNHHN